MSSQEKVGGEEQTEIEAGEKGKESCEEER